jgi:Subunit ChlI of Mg-chelatase
MLAMERSCPVAGLDGALVQVGVDLANGLPAFTIVGLSDAAVNEAKERVRAAIRNSGLNFPLKRITVNLAPADIRKEGPSYDLPMAVGVPRAMEQIVFDEHPGGPRCLFLGELGMDGTLRHTSGILPVVALAREHGVTTVFVPAVGVTEAALVEVVEVVEIIPMEHLAAKGAGTRKAEMLTAAIVKQDADTAGGCRHYGTWHFVLALLGSCRLLLSTACDARSNLAQVAAILISMNNGRTDQAYVTCYVVARDITRQRSPGTRCLVDDHRNLAKGQ